MTPTSTTTVVKPPAAPEPAPKPQGFEQSRSTPHHDAVRFLLEHVARHGDGPSSAQAQQHIDALEEIDPKAVREAVEPVEHHHRTFEQFSMEAGSPRVISNRQNLSPADVGRKIQIAGGAKDGGTFESTITEYISPTEGKLADNAPKDITDASVMIVRDDKSDEARKSAQEKKAAADAKQKV